MNLPSIMRPERKVRSDGIMLPAISRMLSVATLLCVCFSGQALGSDYRQLSIDQLFDLADQGDQLAQVELGTALEHGEGIRKNVKLAISWYCRAASQGSAAAQRNLGWIYANGKGVARDDKLAAYWLKRAEQSGDDYAARLLSHLTDASSAPETGGCSHIANAAWLKRRCSKISCLKIVRKVESLALQYRLDANLVLAVISAESAFNPRAQSPKGASGLMQLIPATARRFGVSDIWDVEENLRGGMAYLQWLLAYFEGNVELALAGYNAGEHRVRQFRGVPPYPETQAYVRRILADYGKDSHDFDRRWLNRSRSAADESVVRNEAAESHRIDGA